MVKGRLVILLKSHILDDIRLMVILYSCKFVFY